MNEQLNEISYLALRIESLNKAAALLVIDSSRNDAYEKMDMLLALSESSAHFAEILKDKLEKLDRMHTLHSKAEQAA